MEVALNAMSLGEAATERGQSRGELGDEPGPRPLQRLVPESAHKEDGTGGTGGSDNPAGSRRSLARQGVGSSLGIPSDLCPGGCDMVGGPRLGRAVMPDWGSGGSDLLDTAHPQGALPGSLCPCPTLVP